MAPTLAPGGDAAAASPRPAGHPRIAAERVGVLLVNLGSPDGTGYWPVRRYLKQFLSDRRVIETWPPLWWLILNGVILTTRPRRSGEAYEKIWNHERNEGPLVTVTRSQAAALAARLAGAGVIVDWAMRYGKPAIANRLRALKEQGAGRILLAPLYPQYSAATTATANDAAFAALASWRWQPAVRTLPPYYDDPAHIAALTAKIEADLAGLDFEPEIVLASFHGLPRVNLDKGDPYYCHCHKTVRLLRERLGWPEERLLLTFQSRFGPAEWLQPYTDVTLAELARKGIRRLAVVTPGFAADCLETLEEIAIRGAETFRANGGESYAALPCLNDSAVGIDMLETLVRRELAGWV
ncbi:MAG TPA: ferrochelatase [Bauldia sp.]|nr:ferrochelatase [Bauldia sp.]